MRTKVFLFTALVMNCLTGFSQKYLWNSQLVSPIQKLLQKAWR